MIELTENDVRRFRAQFPALKGRTIFLENAGGSQVPAMVIDAVSRYMERGYVQLGAGYDQSRKSTELVGRAHDFVKQLMGGEDGSVILGPSTSVLLRMLADCYTPKLKSGQEIVVARFGHEANIGPWLRLEAQGVEIRWWELDGVTMSSPIERLDSILTPKTALVAFPHVSNLLGEILDVASVTRLAHAVDARVVVDGVAYAPHRAMEVSDWGVDWYAFSTYKVYGPHMAALWGSNQALSEIRGPNHFFISDTPYRFELGGVCHEGCAGILGLSGYLSLLSGSSDSEMNREIIRGAYEVMAACELPLQAKLIEFLETIPGVRIVGPSHGASSRVGTISFVHDRMKSSAITAAVDRTEIAIRHGHMYAYRLCRSLGLEPEDGVVRVSLVHYNTEREIDRLIEVLAEVLP